MVNLAKRQTAGEIDKISDLDRIAVLMNSSETLSTLKNRKIEDDLIGLLSNAHENRRAQQVTEWEQMRRNRLGRIA